MMTAAMRNLTRWLRAAHPPIALCPLHTRMQTLPLLHTRRNSHHYPYLHAIILHRPLIDTMNVHNATITKFAQQKQHSGRNAHIAPDPTHPLHLSPLTSPTLHPTNPHAIQHPSLLPLLLPLVPSLPVQLHPSSAWTWLVRSYSGLCSVVAARERSDLVHIVEHNSKWHSKLLRKNTWKVMHVYG